MNFSGVRFADKLLLAYIRNIPNHPFKLRIVNTINDIFFKNEVQLRTENNSSFLVSTREQTGRGLIVQDEYEPLTIAMAKNILKNGGNFVDVGANIGLISILLSAINNVSVYSIEPSINIFARLLENIKASNRGNITPLNIALSYEDSFGYMFNQYPQNLGTMKIVEQKELNSYLIRLCTLFNLLTFLKISEIQLLKIDVEGYEMNVLKGLFSKYNTIYPKYIIIEFNNLIERTGYSQGECLDYIKGLGYTPFNMNGEIYSYGANLPESNLLFKYNN